MRRCGVLWLLVSLLLMSSPLLAQSSAVRLELAVNLPDNSLLLHIMIPRGQAIESATMRSGIRTTTLETEPVPLPVTQWIVLDASDAMLNLQPAVQSAVARILTGSAGLTGIITYDSAVRVLLPTARQTDINDFLADYTATAGQPGCLGDALSIIAEAERDLDRSWRIMLVTGSLSRQTTCALRQLPQLPAPVDIIAIDDSIDDLLLDLVERSGGSVRTANLRTVEARINEVRTNWSQPSFALHTATTSALTESARLEIRLANGISEAVEARFTVIEAEATEEPTPVTLATIPPRPTDTPAPEPGMTLAATTVPAEPTPETTNEAAIIAVDATPEATTEAAPAPASPTSEDTEDSLLLTLGAMIIAVLIIAVLVLRRSSNPTPAAGARSFGAGNFYESLSSPVPEEDPRERRESPKPPSAPVASEPSDITKIESLASLDEDSEIHTSALASSQHTGEDDHTQMLTDTQFERMVQGEAAADAMGWVRLEGGITRDYPVRRSGLLIGRSNECDIVIADDATISRRHARLDVIDGDMVILTRLTTTNPIIVGGISVIGEYALQPGDVIMLSDKTRLIFMVRSPGDEEPDDDETII